MMRSWDLEVGWSRGASCAAPSVASAKTLSRIGNFSFIVGRSFARIKFAGCGENSTPMGGALTRQDGARKNGAGLRAPSAASRAGGGTRPCSRALSVDQNAQALTLMPLLWLVLVELLLAAPLSRLRMISWLLLGFKFR